MMYECDICAGIDQRRKATNSQTNKSTRKTKAMTNPITRYEDAKNHAKSVQKIIHSGRVSVCAGPSGNSLGYVFSIASPIPANSFFNSVFIEALNEIMTSTVVPAMLIKLETDLNEAKEELGKYLEELGLLKEVVDETDAKTEAEVTATQLYKTRLSRIEKEISDWTNYAMKRDRDQIRNWLQKKIAWKDLSPTAEHILIQAIRREIICLE